MSEMLLEQIESSPDAMICDALSLIHKGLKETLGRELISSNDVVDLLLDLQMALTPAEDKIEG